ncbi:MAG: hypothetical protein WC955_11860 [Elusimicrobiota bacterium]
MKELLGFPFNAYYGGKELTTVLFVPEKPVENNSLGYEPIPDMNWVEFEKTEFQPNPGENIESDIIVRIPNDEAILGKKYFFYVYIREQAPKEMKAGAIILAALECSVNFSIANKPPTAEEIRKLKQAKFGGGLSLTISPRRLFLEGVKVGEKYDVKKELGDIIKILNSTNNDAVIEFDIKTVANSKLLLPLDYEDLPDEKYVSIPKKLKVKKNAIVEMPLKINLPKKEELFNKKYYFIITAHVTSKVIDTKSNIAIFIDTENKDEKK